MSTGYICLQRGGVRKGTGEQTGNERLTEAAAQLPSLELVLCRVLVGRVSKKQARNLFLVVQSSCGQANKTLMCPLVTTMKVAL